MQLSSVRGLIAELKEDAEVPKPVTKALGLTVASSAVRARLETAHTKSPRASTIALGVARGRGRGDFQLGARVQLAGARARRVAEELRGKARGECDVRVVPRVRALAPSPAWFRKRRRPLEAGLSTGHFDITAGTLGFVVEDDDAYYALSNNHVLANVNRGQPGDPVLQPGPADRKASNATLVGVLDRFVPISFRRSNVVDCAVASLLDDQEFYVGWTEAIAGRVTGTTAVSVDDLGRRVRKAGRTTGVTSGRITQVEVDRLRVDMGDDEDDPEEAVFSDQFEVQGDGGRPFSLGGDSGSLIVAGRRAIGLLFAGGPDEDGVELTFANRIETVLSKLGVSLAL